MTRSSSPKHKMAQNLSAGPSGRALQAIPREIWQNVFTYLSPSTLADVLRVSRTFNHVLSCSEDEAEGCATKGALRLLSSQNIWESARSFHFPLLPKPLTGCSELAMWRLLLGEKCQFCHQVQTDGGVGFYGNRIIWALALRTCAKCLNERKLAVRSYAYTS